MEKEHYMKVEMPQRFNFDLYGIKSDEAKIAFLEKMCKESLNAPIVKEDDRATAIGVIIESKINEQNDGIISYGIIWCNIEHELFKNNNNYSFSCTVLEDRK